MCLLERVGPPTTARGDVPVDRQRVVAGRDDLDPGADGRPVGLLADELHRQPVVPLAGVLEEDVVVLVAVDGPAHLDEEIDVAVAVPVGTGDAMPFLEVAGARGRGDLGEPLAADVLEHPVGDQRAQVGVAGAQVEVEEAVVVEVAEVAPHGGEDHVQAGFLGLVLEALAVHVVEEPVR